MVAPSSLDIRATAEDDDAAVVDDVVDFAILLSLSKESSFLLLPLLLLFEYRLGSTLVHRGGEEDTPTMGFDCVGGTSEVLFNSGELLVLLVLVLFLPIAKAPLVGLLLSWVLGVNTGL